MYHHPHSAQCLVGLCATCVCEHTKSHYLKGSSPSYENVKDTYIRYNQRMRDQIELIEQDKTWLVLFMWSRATSVMKSMTKGRQSEIQSQKQEKTASPWSTNTSMNLKQKSTQRSSTKPKEIHFTQHTDLKHWTPSCSNKWAIFYSTAKISHQLSSWKLPKLLKMKCSPIAEISIWKFANNSKKTKSTPQLQYTKMSFWVTWSTASKD